MGKVFPPVWRGEPGFQAEVRQKEAGRAAEVTPPLRESRPGGEIFTPVRPVGENTQDDAGGHRRTTTQRRP